MPTRVTLSRGGDSWFLTGLERVDVHPRQSEVYCITVSAAQRDGIVTAALRG